MQEEQGQREECKNEPDIEVQGQVLEVEIPRLGAIEVGASCGREEVILHDIPGDDLNLLVEERVDGQIEALWLISKRTDEGMHSEHIPPRFQPTQYL